MSYTGFTDPVGELLYSPASILEINYKANQTLEGNPPYFGVTDTADPMVGIIRDTFAGSDLHVEPQFVTHAEVDAELTTRSVDYTFVACTNAGFDPQFIARVVNLFNTKQDLTHHSIITTEEFPYKISESISELNDLSTKRADSVFDVIIFDRDSKRLKGFVLVKDGNMIKVFEVVNEDGMTRYVNLGEDVNSYEVFKPFPASEE